MKRILSSMLVTAMLFGIASAQHPTPLSSPNAKAKVQLDFKHYNSYDELTSTLKTLARAYPRMARLESMGKSLQGRDLWVMIVNNPDTGPDSLKPAIYIDGNTHGNEIQGGEISLFTIHYLLTRYGTDPYVTELLDGTAFYIAPTVNPDAREAFVSEPNNPHRPRQNYRPHDNDFDGRIDEDPPEDLDGDGRILSMRLPDSLGDLKLGTDPRSLERRDRDERGQYRSFWTEGIDNDGDGAFNEDSPGGVDLNRNFPRGWEPRFKQWGAGDYPLSEPETRGTVNFMLRHPNIAAVQSYHNSGNMILTPYGDRGDENFPPRDLQMYKAIGKRGEEFLPEYRSMGVFTGLYKVSGGFMDWCYEDLGAMAFSNEIWSQGQDYDKDGHVSDAEALKWSDEYMHGAAFVAWHEFDHPQLGKIEIGGWDQFYTRMPPVDLLEDICLRNCQFTLYHAEMMPRIRVEDVSWHKLTDGLYRLTVNIANVGFMDSQTENAERTGTGDPVIAELTGIAPDFVIWSAERPLDAPDFNWHWQSERLPRPDRIDLGTIQGRSRKVVDWVIQIPDNKARTLQLTTGCDKGGRITQRIAWP